MAVSWERRPTQLSSNFIPSFCEMTTVARPDDGVEGICSRSNSSYLAQES